MKTKTFDCVEMKRAAQRQIRQAVAGMSPEEEIRYFRSGAEQFERRIREAREQLSETDNSTPSPDN
jgi:hypothetical protein